jgi:hypothetical protein
VLEAALAAVGVSIKDTNAPLPFVKFPLKEQRYQPLPIDVIDEVPPPTLPTTPSTKSKFAKAALAGDDPPSKS